MKRNFFFTDSSENLFFSVDELDKYKEWLYESMTAYGKTIPLVLPEHHHGFIPYFQI